MAKSPQKYPFQHLVNWYFGNYCTRKCFDKDERLGEHYKKLQTIAEKNPLVLMTRRDFLDLFNDHLKICTLEENFKRRYIGWKLFERLKATPNYDSDKIIMKDNRIKTTNGELEKPQYCPTCKLFGIV